MTIARLLGDRVQLRNGDPDEIHVIASSPTSQAVLRWLEGREPVLEFPEVLIEYDGSQVVGLPPHGSYRSRLRQAPRLQEVTFNVGIDVFELSGRSRIVLSFVDGQLVALDGQQQHSPDRVDLHITVGEREVLRVLLGASLYSLKTVQFAIEGALFIGSFNAVISSPTRHRKLADIARVACVLEGMRSAHPVIRQDGQR